MSKVRIISMACATVTIALIAGHFMQGRNNVQAASVALLPVSAPTMKPMVEPVAEPVAQAMPVDDIAHDAPSLEVEEIELTSALPVDPAAIAEPIPLPVIAPVPVALEQEPIPAMPVEEAAPSMACDYNLTAAQSGAAMVTLTLNVPCMTNERFTLHHNGMMITGVTDENGMREMTVPALAATPVFIVAFLNGEGAVASAEVSSFEFYDRVVVQWKGNAGFQLHAREFGADYGDAGHVWMDAARDITAVSNREGGFMVRLGDASAAEPLLAEVYTFPSGMIDRGGDIALSVEAEVTADNCGTDVEAQTLQFSADGEMRTQDLILSIPDCGAVGDFLVLKNLVNDLKVAAN